MPFDRKSFLTFVDNERYNTLSKSIRADASACCNEITQVPPQTAASAQNFPPIGPGGASATYSVYNNGSTHWIEIYYGSNYKPNLYGTYIMMQYTPYQYRNYNPTGPVPGFVGCPIDPQTGTAGTGYSLPWNPLYWFSNAYLYSGANNETVEQYVFGTNQVGNLSTARILSEYKRDAIESNSLSFFTPCIESAFDDLLLSNESVMRSQKWLCGATQAPGLSNPANQGGSTSSTSVQTTSIKTFNKLIPLSDVFSTCTNTGYWINSPKVRFQFTMKTGDQICYCCMNTNTTYGSGSQSTAQTLYNATVPASLCSPVYIAVQSIQLLVDSARTTAMQTIDLANEHKDMITQNIAYYNYFPVPATSSSQIVVTSQRDVQTCILGFESYLAPQGLVGANTCVDGAVGPVQNYSQKDSGRVSSISILYGNDQALRQPIKGQNGNATILGNAPIVNPSYPLQDALAYAMYCKASNSDRRNMLAMAIPFDRYFCYHYYYLPIYPSDCPHLTSDPRDLRMDIATTEPARSVVTIVKRFAGVQISANGSVDMLN